MMHYKIISANDDLELIEKVNNEIYKGYRPLGGTSVIKTDSNKPWVYFQAMTRDEK